MFLILGALDNNLQEKEARDRQVDIPTVLSRPTVKEKNRQVDIPTVLSRPTVKEKNRQVDIPTVLSRPTVKQGDQKAAWQLLRSRLRPTQARSSRQGPPL